MIYHRRWKITTTIFMHDIYCRLTKTSIMRSFLCMGYYRYFTLSEYVIDERQQAITTPFSTVGRYRYNDVIMSAMASQITSISIACSSVCSGSDQRKHRSSTSLAFVMRIHRWPVYSPHKAPATQTLFPVDYVVMYMTVKNMIYMIEFIG